MGLQNLITEINSSFKRKECEDTIRDQIRKQVLFSQDISSCTTEIEEVLNEKSMPTLYLTMAVNYFGSMQNTDKILHNFFQKIKESNFKKKSAILGYEVFWESKEFLNEKRLTGLFMGNLYLAAKAFTIDPSKTRVEQEPTVHGMYANSFPDELVMHVTGEYRQHIDKIISLLQPKYAYLKLTEDDSQRIILRCIENNASKKTIQRMRAALQPKKAWSLLSDSKIFSDQQDEIGILIQTKELADYERVFAKTLKIVANEEQTRLSELIVGYNPLQLMRNKRLKDLQVIMQVIETTNLHVMFDYPIITNIDAKNLFEKELSIITQMYRDTGFISRYGHSAAKDIRDGLVLKIAAERLGDEIITKYMQEDNPAFLAYLKSNGYESQNGLGISQENISKSWNLLEFIKLNYAQCPEQYIKSFRDKYMNWKENPVVTGENRIYAAKAHKVKLPLYSKLRSLRVQESFSGPAPNEIYLSGPDGDSLCGLSLKINLDNPAIMPLQEFVCNEVGIIFK